MRTMTMSTTPRVIGAAASPFGMFLDRPMRESARQTAEGALADAGVTADEVGLVIFGNAAAGVLIGQEMIRAQVSLSTSSLAGRPTMSVENACASSSSAFHVGCMAI